MERVRRWAGTVVSCATLPRKNWLPSHLSTAFGLKQGPAGLSATGYVTIASFFGTLIGGVLADRWMRLSQRGRIYTSACGTAMCVPALLGLGYAPTLSVAILFMMLFGLGFGLKTQTRSVNGFEKKGKRNRPDPNYHI